MKTKESVFSGIPPPPPTNQLCDDILFQQNVEFTLFILAVVLRFMLFLIVDVFHNLLDRLCNLFSQAEV